jgi:hypothetical protein
MSMGSFFEERPDLFGMSSIPYMAETEGPLGASTPGQMARQLKAEQDQGGSQPSRGGGGGDGGDYNPLLQAMRMSGVGANFAPLIGGGNAGQALTLPPPITPPPATGGIHDLPPPVGQQQPLLAMNSPSFTRLPFGQRFGGGMT